MAAKEIVHVDSRPDIESDAVPNAGRPARPAPVLGHDELGAVHEHGDEVGRRIGLEDETGDSPFEVAERALRALMAAGFGEDVYPGVAVDAVGGWRWVGVLAVCRVCRWQARLGSL